MPIPWSWVSFYPVAWWPTPTIDAVYDFSINGVTIQDCTWEFIQELNYNDINQIDFDSYNAPLSDGWGVVGYYVHGKDLNLRMVLKWVDEQDLNDKISNIKTLFYGKEKTLQITVDGVARKTLVNLTNLSFNQTQADKTILSNVTATFRAMNDFERTTPQSDSFLWISSDWTEDLINNGEKNTNAKVIMIFWAWTANIDEVLVRVNGYELLVQETIVPWDVLICDWITKQVTLNGVKIAYLWPVDLSLEVGSNLMDFEFDGTTITIDVDITVIYPYRYL